MCKHRVGIQIQVLGSDGGSRYVKYIYCIYNIYIYIYLKRRNPLKITGLCQNIGNDHQPFKKNGFVIKTSGFGKLCHFHPFSWFPCPALTVTQAQAQHWIGIERPGVAAEDPISMISDIIKI